MNCVGLVLIDQCRRNEILCGRAGCGLGVGWVSCDSLLTPPLKYKVQRTQMIGVWGPNKLHFAVIISPNR